MLVKKMKALLITIGCLLVLGGIYAIRSPRKSFVHSSGPDPASDYARPVLDEVSAERRKMTGYASLLVGVGFIAAGVFSKKVDLSKSLDDL
jgi:uncharacterized membrane protein YfcA